MEGGIILTEELLKRGCFGSVVLSKKQLLLFGETLKKGWKKRLIGKTVSLKDYGTFLDLKKSIIFVC